MTGALLLDTESIRESFRQWHAERETLDAELAESLSALAAFQSHLDGWQKKLAHEREELSDVRTQCDADRATIEQAKADLDASNGQQASELTEAREQIAKLNSNLMERISELETQTRLHAELTKELEAARAKAQANETAMDECARAHELERATWNEELRQVRGEMEHRLQFALAEQRADPAPTAPREPVTTEQKSSALLGESPVLESIVQQFGKLRQQRAIDREALRKAR